MNDVKTALPAVLFPAAALLTDKKSSGLLRAASLTRFSDCAGSSGVTDRP
jgi:hypothetical protein